MKRLKKLFIKHENFLNSFSNFIKKYIRASLFIAISFFLVFFYITGTDYTECSSLETQYQESIDLYEEVSPEAIYVMEVRNRIRDRLVSEVHEYMEYIAPGNRLRADLLIDKCFEYDLDIVFVLAQGVLESHLGTKGKAAWSNSVWNVGAYDDGRVLYSYADPNESIDPYMRLVTNNYLRNITPKGDTIQKNITHLLRDQGYINHRGKRFASNREYENGLRQLMIDINHMTSISFYQNLFNLPEESILSYFIIPDLNYSDSFLSQR
jgi:hypothetical protein